MAAANVGLFCIDPGGSTGVAWAILNPYERLAADAMRGRIHLGSDTLTGAPLEQARYLWTLWEKFKVDCVRKGLLPPERVELVSEEFVLTPMSSASGREGTMAERVIWCFEGYRWGRYDTHRQNKHISPIVWQRSGAANRFNSQVMLKPVNAWVKARQHERSALAHMYLRISTIMDSTPRPKRK